jgi:glycosyltransferase involved in cell wall biosynthesis
VTEHSVEEAALPAAVTVVVSTLNRPELLARCLAALAAGRRRPAEVVVVDQGDPEPVHRVVQEACARGLTVIHVRQDRQGLSASQNLGVRTAASPVVAVVDDDCVPDEHWVEVVEGVLGQDDGPDLLGGRILPLPPAGDRVVAVSSRTSRTGARYERPVPPWLIGSGGNFAVRRDRYLRVGGNDERLGTGTPGRAGNDLDLFHRLLRDGAVARYEPDLVVGHERATVEERRVRRGSYGFGVGACIGRWARDRDPTWRRVLVSWVRLRAGELRRRRSWSAASDEARVLCGTLRGLLYGLRLAEPWRREPV